LNEITQRRFGFRLFREHDEYEKLIEQCHRFRVTDRSGLLSLSKDLARLTADSINVGEVHKILKLPKGEQMGSLKSIEALVAAEPQARFVFQNFPLEMHNWAAKGAAYADCVGRASNDAFWKFVSTTYEKQAEITAQNADEKLTALAEGAGVKGSEIAACAAQPETKSRLDVSIALGKKVDVSGTPTVFINGRKIGSFDNRLSEVYKSLVDFAAKEAK
jgi:hypothetical protein